MDYPHEGAALARRLTVLAVITVGSVFLVVFAALVVVGWLVDEDDPTSSTPPEVTTSTTSTTLATTTTSTSTTSTTTTTTIPVAERVLSSLVGELSLERKIEQLLMVGAPGADLMLAIADATGTPCVGGVFVADNAGNWAPADDRAAAADAMAGIAAAASECAIRPLVATDAEPGTRVLKVPVAPLPAPGPLLDAFSADPDGAAAVIEAASARFAGELAALGVHVNFGVVADVDVDDAHYMARRGRSFGADPQAVASITEAMVRGHCAGGVAATLKHFPNQGATLADPHTGVSVSSTGPGEWESLGRVPYVDTPAPVVMTGHVVYDGVDEDRPASLSAEITTGWLRDGLDYGGVVVTDDLQTMRGATDVEPSAAQRAVAAVSAGADLVLFVDTVDVESTITALFDRAVADPTFSARIDESVDRVLRLKSAFGLVDGLEVDWFGLCSLPRVGP